MDQNPEEKKQLINCHTHIFTGEHVPPEIGKTFLFWPLYKWLSVPVLLKICRFWYLDSDLSPYASRFTNRYKDYAETSYKFKIFLVRNKAAGVFSFLLTWLFIYHALIYLCLWLNLFVSVTGWLNGHDLCYKGPVYLQVLTFVLTFLLFETGRKLISLLLKKAWGFLSMIPDKKTLQFYARYINIGRYAYYQEQSRIFGRLQKQYPVDTGFVILPMDMEFMDAGVLKDEGRYGKQMAKINELKKSLPKGILYPFVFIDPRRKVVDGETFLDWEKDADGKVVLKLCFIKNYIEDKKFSGFKIYPALGYYPFDEALLPLWIYAAEHQIPITTHCIRGTIFYRGAKKKAWDHHPVFMEKRTDNGLTPLLLPEIPNVEFINNFTHPLNYLCLVEEKLLRVVVSKTNDSIKDLFGFHGLDKPMDRNLSDLKLCFGHYGGDDEWAKYFEKDRDDFTSQIVRVPERGILFCKGDDITQCWGSLEQVWKYVDWYSIVTSMLLQYDNLYADISYIVENDSIIPLLKSSLQQPKLARKILFGTDFYVVRNHKSEREMLAEMRGSLSETEFDLIARENPDEFLKTQ